MKPDWLTRSDVQALLGAAERSAIPLRFVGGAVRGAVRREKVEDFDLATPVPAERVMEKLQAQGIKVIPTGIAHGTVTAVLDAQNFEITTLRRDLETDGRHAKIAFTDDWREDAARRDFTMNALYLSPEGELFDYFEGQEDAKAGRVRFIGDAAARILEDGLRILRFFRFHAQLGALMLDAEGLQACRTHAAMLEKLSGERIQAEMLKLIRARDPIPALSAMQETGIYERIIPTAFAPALLKRLMEVEKKFSLKPCTKLRMAALIGTGGEPAFLKSRWKCSGEFLQTVVALLTATRIDPADESSVKRTIRRHGNRMAAKLLTFQWAADDHAQDATYLHALEIARNWQPPVFPVTGADLMARGIPEGKELGERLKRLEAMWEESDYRLTKDELLKQ